MPNVKIFGVSLNPGPFTVKEHVLITIMATVGYQSAYAVSTSMLDPWFSGLPTSTDTDGHYCGPAGIL